MVCKTKLKGESIMWQTAGSRFLKRGWVHSHLHHPYLYYFANFEFSILGNTYLTYKNNITQGYV